MNPNDAGEPIRVLREQAWETRPDFLSRLRRRIYRRTATKQVATYSWNLPKLALIEMAGLLGHIVSAFKPNKRT